MVINFSVTNEGILILIFDMKERLVSFFSDIKNGKSVETNHGRRAKMNNRVVRPPGLYGLIASHLLWSYLRAVHNSPNPTHL